MSEPETVTRKVIAGGRLDSWKEVAAYLGISVRSAQRWEQSEGLPVKRHRHQKQGSIYAFVSDLDRWRKSRTEPRRHERITERTTTSSLSSATVRKSIAVLPFENLDHNPEIAFIGDGLADDLITALAQVDGLRVIARTSSFRFGNQAVDVRDLGRKLGAGIILQGSIRRLNDRLRVSAHLINTSDGCTLWAQRFDRPVGDLFELCDDLCRKIVQRILAQPDIHSTYLSKSATDSQTYDLFLRGRYFWNQRSKEGLKRALMCYSEAIRRDLLFARARAALSTCYVFLWVYGGHSWNEVIPKAGAAASDALRIDPNLADAESALGIISIAKYDLNGAHGHFARALKMNPNDAQARHWNAMCMACLGRFDQALEAISLALEYDRFGMVTNQDRGRILYLARRYNDAIRQLEDTQEIAPEAPFVDLYLGFAYAQNGQHGAALRVFHKNPILGAVILALTGDSRNAAALLESNASTKIPAWQRALLHLGRGEHKMAIEHLGRAKALHEPMYIELCPAVQPLFDSLRPYPEFKSVVGFKGIQ